jgi:hypothetical protein
MRGTVRHVRSYLDRALVAFGLAVVAGLISLACTGPPAAEKAADESAVTAEQCIDDKSTDGPVEPLEDALLTAGVVEKDLDEITLTQDMCKEVVERTPGGSPVERAAAVGNLTQELGIIENSMEDASEGDVDGDGGVDAKDGEIAASASFAASQAARRTITRASEEGLRDGDAPTEIDAQPAAYLAQQQSASVPAQASSSPSTVAPTAEPTYESTYESTTASAAASATASASAGAGGAQQVGGSVRDEAVDDASRAARRAGAGQKAAAGGSQCAATVKLTDASLRVTRGYVVFKGPARELRWNDSDEARLVVAPKALSSIEELRREIGRAAGAGKAEADCMHLGTQIKPIMRSNDDGLSIDWHDVHEKEIRSDTSVSWTWGIRASQSGPHYLILNLEQYVITEAAGEERRSFEESPFDDYIVRVHATRWQILTSFLGGNWQVFVPVFLTLLTAIVIPLVVFFWRRRNRPHGPGGVSGRPPPDDGWL